MSHALLRLATSPPALLAVATVTAAAAVALALYAASATPPAAATGPASPAAAPTPTLDEGDPGAGQRVAVGGAGAGVGGACFQCHGLDGAGDVAGAFPRLAAQPAYYLYKQLVSFANGTRPDAVMTPIAAQLTDAERRDVALYYAAARAPFRAPEDADAERLLPGARIAATGSTTRGVQSCVGCHGPAGSGVPPDTPYLAGLSAAYMEQQLARWHAGTRTNDTLGVMRDIARRLTPEERRSVALYFAALRPPDG